jgi:hypothetical protein
MEVVVVVATTWRTALVVTQMMVVAVAPICARRLGISLGHYRWAHKQGPTAAVVVVVAAARMFKPVNPCLVLQVEAELSLFGGLLRI